MKFLHAADIHLDSPLAGLARRSAEAVPPEVVRHCTRRAFERLIALAIAEDVAFLLIAGDLYDGDWRDFSTGLYFNDQMRLLGRPCIIVHGNHDARSVITKELTLPPNVHVLSSERMDSWRDDSLGVVVHGRSFPTRWVADDFSAGFPGPERGWFNIAMLHTSGDDPGPHEVYAPCRIGSLAAKGYDYWALGHVHERRVLLERPHIVYPGNLQGRHVRETGAKGATLVEVEDRRVVRLEHRALDVLRWARIELDLTDCERIEEIGGRTVIALTEPVQAAEGRPLLARVVLGGATSLHQAFLGDPRRVEAECRDAARSAGGEIHLERVVIDTRPARSADPGRLEGLAEAFRAGAEDEAVVADLLADMEKLAVLSPRLDGHAEPAVPRNREALRELLPDAWAIAVEALNGTSGP